MIMSPLYITLYTSVADPGGDPREQRNPPFAQNVRIDF